MNLGFQAYVATIPAEYDFNATSISLRFPFQSCVTANVLVHGPYQRVGASQAAVYSSYVISSIVPNTGSRTYTDGLNASSSVQLLSVVNQPLLGPPHRLHRHGHLPVL